MNNFVDLLKSVYTKDKVKDLDVDTSLTIALSKWLAYDESNIQTLKNLVKYLFYLEPINYYYLLYLSLPQRSKAPYLNKIQKENTKENKILEKIKKILRWSDRELVIHYDILDKLTLSNLSYWKEELNIE